MLGGVCKSGLSLKGLVKLSLFFSYFLPNELQYIIILPLLTNNFTVLLY
jgi:hypothetical protein